MPTKSQIAQQKQQSQLDARILEILVQQGDQGANVKELVNREELKPLFGSSKRHLITVTASLHRLQNQGKAQPQLNSDLWTAGFVSPIPHDIVSWEGETTSEAATEEEAPITASGATVSFEMVLPQMVGVQVLYLFSWEDLDRERDAQEDIMPEEVQLMTSQVKVTIYTSLEMAGEVTWPSFSRTGVGLITDGFSEDALQMTVPRGGYIVITPLS